MGYTDKHAVLPARNILVWVALICAVLFFVTVWRRTWLLPGVGVSLLVVTSILLGLIWPAFVQHFQVDPTEPDKESSYIQQNIEATRAAYDLNDIQEVHAPGARSPRPAVQDLIDQTESVPVLDPSRISSAFEQIQQVASLLLGARRARRRPLPDRRHRPRAGARGARARPDRDHPEPAELDQPAHRLHPRQRRDRGLRQPATRRQRHREPADPVGGGSGARAGRAPELDRRVREPGLLRGGQPQLLDRRQDAGRPRPASSTWPRTARAPRRRTPAGAVSRSAASSAS